MSKFFVIVSFITCVAAQLEPESNRIANGNIAAELQFPYAISLQQLGNAQLLDTRGHRCGGVLFTLQHALTVASCLFNTLNGNFLMINPSEYRIFAGSSLLNNDTSADRIRSIANFTIHPQYLGPPAYVNDIAIITFVTPFSSNVVKTLSLPINTFDPADYTPCTVAGWGGANASALVSTALRYANKYVYNQNQCTFLYNPVPGSVNILPSMLCAVSYDIISSGCMNDIGNALVCDNTLTGVLFMSDACRSSSFPEIYTRISNYTTWIRSVSSASAIFASGVQLLLLTALSFLLFN